MQQTEYRIVTDYIELNQLLKVCGLASSGGEGAARVTEGNVRVDGQPELRKRCKIRAGQVVQLGDVRIAVLAADPAEIAALAEARIESARVKAAKKKAGKSPPGVWAPTGAKPGVKFRAKVAGQPLPKSSGALGKPKPKTNVFAEKAEAHRRNRKP
jgi:ribosome-associated protein